MGIRRYALGSLLSEKGYITQEDALKSDTIGRACVYMQTHLGEKLTAESVAAYAHISSRHFVRKFRAEMNETFAEYLLRIRIKAAIGMLKNGKDVKSIPEAVGYKDKKSFCTAVLFLRRLLSLAQIQPLLIFAHGAAAGIRRRRSSVDAKANQGAHAEMHVRFA